MIFDALTISAVVVSMIMVITLIVLSRDHVQEK
jgi:hypothetical protein